jgi:hypothetical protein
MYNPTSNLREVIPNRSGMLALHADHLFLRPAKKISLKAQTILNHKQLPNQPTLFDQSQQSLSSGELQLLFMLHHTNLPISLSIQTDLEVHMVFKSFNWIDLVVPTEL